VSFEWTKIPGPTGPIACWSRDAGPEGALPVFFVHPINTQGACWVEVARRLDRQCVMPDLRGHGASGPNGPFGIGEWAADCLTVMDHLEIEQAHFVGGSLGGPIAIQLAAEHPERVASIASFGGALSIEGDEAEEVLDVLRRLGVKGMFRSVIPEISVGPETDAITLEWILSLTNPNDVDTVYAIWTATLAADVSEHIGTITCPVLVANGEHDKTCTPAQAKHMAEAFDTTLRVLPGVGHLPMCEAPELVAYVVQENITSAEKAIATAAGTTP
jgi:3-oxoadipate enol-lactonase